MNVLKRILLNIAYVSFGVLLGLGWNLRAREVTLGSDAVPPTSSGSAANQSLRSSGTTGQRVTVTLEQDFIVARPENPNGVVFVHYPGGRVQPQAYEFIARALAAEGVTVAIPIMPLELAVIAPNRAAEVRSLLEASGFQIKKFVVGGHSLGGAMAARYAAGNNVDGLVLTGSFSPDDLSMKTFPVLNLAAEFDGIASLNEVRQGLSKLPAGTTVEVLPGGVHAFFGRYGPQAGDGTPTVTRDVFERLLLGKLSAFFARLAAS